MAEFFDQSNISKNKFLKIIRENVKLYLLKGESDCEPLNITGFLQKYLTFRSLYRVYQISKDNYKMLVVSRRLQFHNSDLQLGGIV